jgi:hypothetical protein
MNIVTVEKNYNALISGNFNYQVTYDNGQISFVPHNEENKDYQAIQEWIADGGTVIDNGGGE